MADCQYPNCVCYGRCVLVAKRHERDRTNCLLPACSCQGHCMMAPRWPQADPWKAENWMAWHGVICPYCGKAMDVTRRDRRPSTDHIIPVSKGGRRGPTVICCYLCNQWKGDRLLDGWLAALRKINDARAPHVEAFIRSLETEAA